MRKLVILVLCIEQDASMTNDADVNARMVNDAYSSAMQVTRLANDVWNSTQLNVCEGISLGSLRSS